QQAPVCSGVMAMTNDFLAVVRPLAPQVPPGTPVPAPPPAPGGPLSPPASGRPRPASSPGGAAVGAGRAGEASETATAQLVSGNFFSALGVGMAVGRAFLAEEDAVPGGHPLAVIS